nr:15432_t:CDS:2 [Entrophospora candida]
MKTNKKTSPPKKVVESIRKEMTNPNFPYKNINLMPDATPLEKNKYEICQKILAYKQDNKLTIEKVAKSIQLTIPETEDIFFGRINKFTLDRLVEYATKLGIFLQKTKYFFKIMGKYSKKRVETSRKFTSAEKMKDNFFANSARRRKAGDKVHGDAADDVNEIKLSANEEIFNQKKQALISKVQDCINKCQATETYSIANIQKLEPKHQKELLKLEAEAKQAENEYKENKSKADQETDPDKKAEFMLLANKAAKKAEEIKRKVKTNPLADLSRFSNLDTLTILLKGNVPKKTPSSSKANNSSSSQNTSSFNHSSTDTNNHQLLIFAGIALLLIFYFYTQKEENYNF